MQIDTLYNIRNNQEYIESAITTAKFIENKLYKNDRLFRNFKDNIHKYNAYLDDHAFYIAAVLNLYEATHDIIWLDLAIELDSARGSH